MFGFEPKIQQSKCCVLTNYTTFQFLRRTVESNHIQFYPDAQLSRLPLSPFSIILHFVPRTRFELVQTMQSKGFSYHTCFYTSKLYFWFYAFCYLQEELGFTNYFHSPVIINVITCYYSPFKVFVVWTISLPYLKCCNYSVLFKFEL